jgi:hypothetical protein
MDLPTILIDNKKYLLLEHLKTFEELKKYFVNEFGILVTNFCVEDSLIANSEKTTQHYSRKLTGVSDGHKYTKNGHGLRCSSCRKNLSTIDWICRHDSKCKCKLSRTKIFEQSVSHESISKNHTEQETNINHDLTNLTISLENISTENLSNVKFNSQSSIEMTVSNFKSSIIQDIFLTREEAEAEKKQIREEAKVREIQLQDKAEARERQIREEAKAREKQLREEIENLKKENNDKLYIPSDFYSKCCNSDMNTIQNLISGLQKEYSVDSKGNTKNIIIKNDLMKKSSEIFIKKIFEHKKPIYLIIKQAIDKLLNILKIKNEQFFKKKIIHEAFKKIENFKTKAYKNTFEIIRSYKSKNKCFFCCCWIEKKNFHRHIDECQKYPFEKDFCYKCKRYVILKIIIDEKNLHKHICYRKPKFIQKIKIQSKERWKRRKLGEKRRQNKKNKRKIYQQLDFIYLKKIISNFVNQRRENLIEKIEDIKKGYPEEYLNLYEDDKKITYHFKRFFGDFIGDIGRFYGDTAKEKYFDPKKALKIYREHQLNFDYIDGFSNEHEKTIIEEKIQNSLLNLSKIRIPKFRNVKIYEDLIKTYLLACAQRREIDKEMGFH